LQQFQHPPQTIHTNETAPRADVVPREYEPRQDRLHDRLDLAAQRRERPSAHPPQDLGIDPFRAGTTRAELTLDDPTGALERLQATPYDLDGESEAAADSRDLERPVRARIARQDVTEWRADLLQQSRRQAGRQLATDPVAVARRVLRCDPA